jgi:hypothetical protein
MENLISTSILEFIKTYFYDFLYNNCQIVKNMNLNDLITEFEKAAIYYSKLIMHYEYFYKYRYECYNHSFSLKAIACILNGYELLLLNKKISKENEKILYEWVYSINLVKVYRLSE